MAMWDVKAQAERQHWDFTPLIAIGPCASE